MGSGKNRVGSPELDKVLTLLEGIRNTETGNIIFEHVSDMLKEIDSFGSHIDQIYAEMLGRLLSAISSQFDGDEHIAVQLTMLRLRLAPPVSKSQLITLKKYIDLVASNIEGSFANVAAASRAEGASHAGDSSRAEGASHAGSSSRAEGASHPEGASHAEGSSRAGGASHTESTSRAKNSSPVDNSNSIEDSANLDKTERKSKNPSENSASQFDAVFQRRIKKKNKEISEIRDTLARHVGEAIAHNDQFGVLLGVELEALKGTISMKDVDGRRTALVKEISQLIENHAKLSEKFNNASKYLTMIESDNQQLSNELDRVRLLSLTDELTTLSNRRAFMRRLEDEVGRVKRYGYPITLTLMDLDKFKNITDKYGQAGGDAVLKSYAEEVLTIFRHHDMIARYGGEKFAVILPNTDKTGALSALRKVQQGVAQIFCVLNDETLPMPTFSAGLAQYIGGETPAEFIERADNALHRAKEQGRNKIHVADDAIPKEGGSDRGIVAKRS